MMSAHACLAQPCTGMAGVAVPIVMRVPRAQPFTGTVGAPLPLLTFRLEAVPDMGYDPAADPPRGEVVIKGPVVFQGYYKVGACPEHPKSYTLPQNPRSALKTLSYLNPEPYQTLC